MSRLGRNHLLRFDYRSLPGKMEGTMNGKRILIIEDDSVIREAIEETFRLAGAVIQSAPNGQEGLRQFYQFQPHLVTLDVLMPHTDGWETCRQIRKLADTPIIMLTGVKDEMAEVRALDMGAVDFVTKPFRPRVLLARARAALRQAGNVERESAEGYRDNYLTVDLVKRRVWVNGELLKLTKTEYELLAYLVGNKGRVLTFEQILDSVWGTGYANNPDYVHVYISRLRQKIELDPRQPNYLLSERGVGYRFEGTV